MLKGFGELERYVNLDFHRLNTIVNDKNLSKIDNHKREPRPYYFDIAKNVFQGSAIPYNNNKKFIHNNIKLTRKEIGKYHEVPDFEDFLENTLRAGPIKALSYASYVLEKNHLSEYSIVKQTLINASNVISELESLVEFSEQDKIILNKFNDSVLSLSNYFKKEIIS